ncbi:hypothetical protein CLU93_2720 [Janthinobacterium sp. 35]|uniref:hypothetical protein n=1 Tax=unclassified Janthinobacterium TaxID=2610881 RepID=UPI000C4F1E89|nr:hypothetical protein [Janthinobacterium sp. 35]PIG28426.1 hypothetical protein CLU93_2720 [Janthinobacterium sp. 35]
MFMPRHPKPLLSTRAVATQVAQQKQGTQAMDKHVLIVDVKKPAPGVPIMPPVPVKQD